MMCDCYLDVCVWLLIVGVLSVCDCGDDFVVLIGVVGVVIVCVICFCEFVNEFV